MKKCTGLWIVAPITRAVDDKAAKSLLGNTFKRQLKYDGTYSAVTFICSKTDDISRTEAADSLKLGPEMTDLEDQLSDLEHRRRDLQKTLKSSRGQKEDHTAAIESIDEQLEKWDDLRDQLEDGKTVYAPATPTKKRKRRTQSPVARKRAKGRRTVDSDDDDDVVYVDSDSDGNKDDGPRTDRGAPLTEEHIEKKLKELSAQKKEARRKKGKYDDQIRELRSEVTQIGDQETDLDARRSEMCIAGRNEYSRSAIREDFAAGIKELDQENAEEEDPDNFTPEEDIRDYDEVARSLPVYCVSSRAYQKICGRMLKDSDVPGFTTKEQTEIPQLQAHCKKLTENGRLGNCRRFLNKFDQLLSSLGFWASDDGTGAKLTTKQRDAEKSFLQRVLKDLERALERAVKDKLEDVSETLNEQLFDKYRPAIDAAANDAMPTAYKWGGSRDQGGLQFMTYRATVRRNGVFQGASGFQDFNQQLFDPVQKHLASGWEKAFHRRLPNILQSFTRTGSDLLNKFHTAVENRCKERGHGVARIGMLQTQLTAYQAIFTDMIAITVGQVNEGQREINREFVPTITSCMEQAYDQCGDERGAGCYKRMKGHMAVHVDENKMSMFNEACEQVRKSLLALVDQVGQQMLDRVDSVYINMQRDYMSIIGGVNVRQVAMSREERSLRRELDDSITTVDDVFQKLIDSDAHDLRETSALKENDGQQDGHDIEDEIAFDEESGVESGAESDDEEETEGADIKGTSDDAASPGYTERSEEEAKGAVSADDEL